jgi:hypothetical protein
MAEHHLSRVEITFMRKVNWSLLAAGIPAVWKLDIHNGSSESLEPMELKVWIGGRSDLYVDSGLHHLPAIAADNSHSVEAHSLHWRSYFNRAMRVTKPQPSELHIRLGSYHGSCPIDLLTPDEWQFAVACLKDSDGQITFTRDPTVELTRASFKLPAGGKKLYLDRKDDIEEKWVGSPPIEIAAAAFCSPRHEKIIGLVRTTHTMLKALRKRSYVSIDECLSAGPSCRVDLISTLITALEHDYRHLFHTIEDVSFEARTQRIRSFDNVLATDPQKGQMLTCIEAAFILCSEMINVGFSPLLVIVGTGENRLHALVGARLEEPEDESALYRDVEELCEQVADGKLLIVDVTQFLLRKVDFEQSCIEGKNSLRFDSFVYAVNICKAWEVYKFRPLSELASKMAEEDSRRRFLMLVAKIAAAVSVVAIPMGLYPLLDDSCRALAMLTHINDRSVGQHQATVIVGDRVAEVALSGKIKPNSCQDDKIFIVIDEGGAIEIQGPAERVDDNWSNRVLLRLPPGSDAASFDLAPLIAAKELNQDEARRALREQQGSQAVTVAMKLAYLTIESAQPIGAYAELHGTAKNLPDGTVVLVETEDVVDDGAVEAAPGFSKLRGKAEVNGGVWKASRISMRDNNEGGKKVNIRVKLSPLENDIYAGDKIISRYEGLKVPEPYVKITRVSDKDVQVGRLGPTLAPGNPVLVEGVAGNLLPDDTIWLRVYERGLNGAGAQILPETGADLIAKHPSEDGSIGWSKTVAIGSGVKFTIKAGVCSNPPINEEDFVGFSGISDTVECQSRR